LKKLATSGLILYCIIAGWGPFIGHELSSPWLFPWLAGFLALVLVIAYNAYITPPPIKPFRFIVLGILLLNFMIQVTGGIHSSLWSAYFLYAVFAAAFSPPGRAYGMVALLLTIESANLYLHGHDLAERWHVYAVFGLSLSGVSIITSHIMHRARRQMEEAQDAHARLLAKAESVDSLMHESRVESLTQDHRQAHNVKTAHQREITFAGLIEMIDEFVPAHTYALFLRERREGVDRSVLRAIQTGSAAAVLPIGTDLDPTRDKTYIDVCAEQRQSQYLSDIMGMGIAPAKLGYYRPDAKGVPVRSFLVVPIIPKDQDRVVAVLAVDSFETGAFSEEDRDTITRFSTFFNQIIEKVQMALDLKKQADRFGALHEISMHLNESLKFNAIMDTVIPQIGKIVPFDQCACLLLIDRDGNNMLQVAGLAGYRETLKGKEFLLKDSPVIEQMHRLWTEQGMEERYSPDLRGKISEVFPIKDMQLSVRSLYGRLLVAKKKVVGAFFIAASDPDAFTKYHRKELLDTLLNQISMVAYNSLLYQQIEGMARTDGLTGLLNHRTFTEKLADKHRELDRMPRPFSILLMDIDKFKAVNDKYGHPVGDQAIKAVARVLQDTIRSTDFVARYGGEEFAVGMIETDSTGAVLIAERVRRIMEQTSVTRVFDGELKVTLSIGVASFPEDTDTAAHLVTMADEALYHAKRSGRNRVCTHREARNSPQPAAEA
jgi:diguanylate cyclase (GGDEF)-like protein